MTPSRWPRREIAWIGLVALLLSAVSVATAFARNPLKLPDTQYEPIGWAKIDGWADDDHNAALATFLKSCQAILKGAESRPGQPMFGALFRICQKAVAAKPEKPGEARAFFEQNFRPVRISPLGTPDGFVTGYYEPIVDGMRNKGDGYEHPLYRKPSNLLPGFNAIDGSADTLDENGHGSEQAALIGSVLDNGLGTAGICGRCRILPVKVFDADGRANVETIARGIRWASRANLST